MSRVEVRLAVRAELAGDTYTSGLRVRISSHEAEDRA
jgi:hypothetical protein